MSKKKTINNPRNNNTTNARQRSISKKSLWIIAFIVLLSTLIIFWLTTGESLLRQAEMTSYLKSKYGEDFVVKKPEYKNGGLGVQGIWVAQVHAHTVNSSQLDFEVSCSSSDLSACSDTYLDSFFSKQEYDRLKPVMDSMNAADYSVRIIIGYDALDNITKNTELVHIKQKYNPIYKLKVSINKASTKNEVTDKVAAIANEAYRDGISRVEIEYKVSTADGKIYRCATNYEINTQLTSESISKCLKEV